MQDNNLSAAIVKSIHNNNQQHVQKNLVPTACFSNMKRDTSLPIQPQQLQTKIAKKYSSKSNNQDERIFPQNNNGNQSTT